MTSSSPNRSERRRRNVIIAKTSAIISSKKRAMERQKTLDHLDKVEADDAKFGQRKSEARVVMLDNAPYRDMDPMAFRKAISEQRMCKVVAKMGGCTVEEAADRIVSLIIDGTMACAMIEGELKLGIVKKGWDKVRKARK